MKKTRSGLQGKLLLNKKNIMPLLPGASGDVYGGQQLPTGPHGCTVGTSETCPPTMWPPTHPPGTASLGGAPCCPAPASFTCKAPVAQ